VSRCGGPGAESWVGVSRRRYVAVGRSQVCRPSDVVFGGLYCLQSGHHVSRRGSPFSDIHFLFEFLDEAAQRFLLARRCQLRLDRPLSACLSDCWLARGDRRHLEDVVAERYRLMGPRSTFFGGREDGRVERLAPPGLDDARQLSRRWTCSSGRSTGAWRTLYKALPDSISFFGRVRLSFGPS